MGARNCISVVLLAVVLSTGSISADAGDLVKGTAQILVAAVPGHPAIRWGDALKLLLLDVRPGADGSIEARQIAKARRLDAADEVAADGPVHASWLSALDIVEGGQPRLLIFAEMDQPLSGTPGSALLALIDPTSQPRLLDLVDVGDDRENDLDGTPRLKLGPGSDFITVSSTHASAGEDATIRKALFVERDRFGLAASVPLLSLKICGYEREQTGTFAVHAKPGQEFGSLEVTVSETARRAAGDCEPRPRQKTGRATWHATFRWNPATHQFETTSRELEALAKHNGEGL